MPERGKTLTEADVAALKPVRGEGGKSLRAYCPFHGSDQQRSLRIHIDSGRFQCFACSAWGYMNWARNRFLHEKKQTTPLLPRPGLAARPPAPVAGLADWLARYQTALPGSLGEQYLLDRRIPPNLAQSFGVGYAPPGQWAHRSPNGAPVRDYPYGRLVFPHLGPQCQLLNLYGRALGDQAPKSLRHDHLPGPKGYFNFPALLSDEPVYICEGPFDALSLMAARPSVRAVAIFGVNGWRDIWANRPKEFIFALDSDSAGQKAWKKHALGLIQRGKRVRYLSTDSFGGAKDVNEAWICNCLHLE